MERIVVSPQIHFGKPTVKGTRITVQNVLELLNEGLNPDQIIKDYYPDLKQEDIKACLQYTIAPETALLSEAALAEDWMRLEEDDAWSYLRMNRKGTKNGSTYFSKFSVE